MLYNPGESSFFLIIILFEIILLYSLTTLPLESITFITALDLDGLLKPTVVLCVNGLGWTNKISSSKSIILDGLLTSILIHDSSPWQPNSSSSYTHKIVSESFSPQVIMISELLAFPPSIEPTLFDKLQK